MEAGIIDPAKVVLYALQDATSVASPPITTEAMIAERRRGTTRLPRCQGGGLGGMDY
jgi:chaperonin GroEL